MVVRFNTCFLGGNQDFNFSDDTTEEEIWREYETWLLTEIADGWEDVTDEYEEDDDE